MLESIKSLIEVRKELFVFSAIPQDLQTTVYGLQIRNAMGAFFGNQEVVKAHRFDLFGQTGDFCDLIFGKKGVQDMARDAFFGNYNIDPFDQKHGESLL